jgi:hypothetical protein
MESKLSVLLYSKYSSLSTTLMNSIEKSGINFTNQFSLQSLCIDNEKVRSRIINDTQLDVSTVPCLLIVFPDGGIEKYDGARVFEWFDGVIRQFSPPPPPPQIHVSQPIQSDHEKQLIQQEHEQKEKLKNRKKISDENRRQYNQKYQEHNVPSTKRPRNISNESSKIDSGVTNIEDLEELPPDEDEQSSGDRYRSRKPVAHIRTNEGNYEENDELFRGSPPDPRRSVRNAVKVNDSSSKKSLGIMEKAKEMAKGREDSQPPPPGHPENQNN